MNESFPVTWSFDLSWISATKKGNGVLRHFKDKPNFLEFIFFSIETRDRSSLVNRSKSGVVVNLRQGNLTSMCDWHRFTISFLWKSSMHLQVPLAIFFKTTSGQIMMNISEHGNYSNSLRFIFWVIYQTSLLALFIRIMYICSLVYHTSKECLWRTLIG